MLDAAEMAERRGRVLAELSELGLALARDLQARALAAEAADTAAELGQAFHRVSRSVRQTLALEAKLERDRRRQMRDDRAQAGREIETRVQRRRAQVRLVVERAVWDEAEDLEAERLLDELDDHLEEAALSDDFLEVPLEAHIARLHGELGLSSPPPSGEERAPGFVCAPNSS